MSVNPELLAPCGLYCGVCELHRATQAGDHAFLQRLVRIYARRVPEMAPETVDDLLCDGCLSARRSIFCRECPIRACVQQKELEGCHQCPDFSCSLIDQFPLPVGKSVILRAVPYRRARGTEQWVLAEEQRYHCPECGQRLFRGARQCRHCHAPVDVD